MAGGPRDVNQLWAELKKSSAPPRRSGVSLSGLTGLPGITTSVRVYDKSRGPAQPTQRPSFFDGLGQTAKALEQQQAGDHGALLASLQRDINGLSDPDRATRRRAVEKLHAALLGPPAAAAPDALQAALAGPLLVPLVRLLADPAEKCRELSAAFLAAALPALPAPAAVLHLLVPALAERVGSAPPQEPSEEMRLALAELTAGPLLGTLADRSAAAGGAAARQAAALPPDLLAPLCAVLCCQLADPFADIKKAACTGVGQLARLLGAQPLPAALLQPLVSAAAACLSHQHSRVRLAALQALDSLVQSGMPIAAMQEAVLPAVRPLALDHSPAIRAALFSCAARWSGSELPAAGGDAGGGGDAGAMDTDEGRAANQCAAFLPLLLPLLLLGPTDESEAIRSAAFASLEAIGARLGKQGGPDSARQAVDRSGQPLPGFGHPFCGRRPCQAACGVVQAQLPQLLRQCLADLQEWTATLRASTARLLRAALVYGEGEVLPLLPSVVLALRGAVGDDDADVASHAVACAHVLGGSLQPRHWMPLAAEAVAAFQQSVAQRTAALVVLSALLYAASKAGTATDSESLQLGASTLGSAGLAAAAVAPDGGPLRQQLLAACSNLVQWAGPRAGEVAPQLFQLLLQLWVAEADGQAGGAAAAPAAATAQPASSGSNGAGALTAAGVLDQLAAALGGGGTSSSSVSQAGLADLYGPSLLHCCLQGHEGWSHDHPGWRTTSALLRLSGPSALLRMWPSALPALQAIAAGHERDPRLQLDALHLAAALLEDDGKAEAWPQAGAGQSLLARVLCPALVWRAGRVPAAARYAALAALGTLLARQRVPADQVAAAALPGCGSPQVAAAERAAGASAAEAAEVGGGKAEADGLLARVAGCLDEDYEPETRQLACRVMALLLGCVGRRLPADQLRGLQPALLARLDDSSNRVRVAACEALAAWLACALAAGADVQGMDLDGPAAAAEAAGLSDADAASLAGAVLIHLDDPDAEVAHGACAVLEALATACPGAVEPAARTAAAQHARRDLAVRVLAACERASVRRLEL